MASRLSKFPPRILVSSVAIFIFLSVSTSGEEPTRCYWCGPLAEQVHRSQRAPSCDIFDLEQHETVCDKGYTHCATVAVSPPYSESRLCVKFYQDECYSLYCNSTKTWRMVCACRGNLCNGPHTDREIEAFALVPKFLTKTKPRNKRSLISGFISVKTKTPSYNNTLIFISNNGQNTDTSNILQSDQPAEPTQNSTRIVMTHTPKQIEKNIIIEHGTFKNTESSITHTSPSKAESNNQSKTHNAQSTTPSMDDKHLEDEDAKSIGNSQMDKSLDDNVKMNNHLDNTKIDKHDKTEKDKHLYTDKLDHELKNVTSDKHDNAKTTKQTPIIEYTTPADFVRETQVFVIPFTTVKPTSVEIDVAVVNSVTHGELPPAEALQQNVTPTKPVEVTTIGTIVTSTENNHMAEKTMSSETTKLIEKNSATQKNIGYHIIITACILVYYI